MGGLRAWRALDPLERSATLAALIALPAIRFGLRLFGYRRCHRWVARRSLGPTSEPSKAVVSSAYQQAVDRVARRLPGGASCLPRSLCLFWLLHRRGIMTDLKIGVRRAKGGALEGHAWVELHGEPLNDTADVGERFAPFEGTSLPEISRIAS